MLIPNPQKRLVETIFGEPLRDVLKGAMEEGGTYEGAAAYINARCETRIADTTVRRWIDEEGGAVRKQVVFAEEVVA